MILAAYTRWTQYMQYLDCPAYQATYKWASPRFVNLLHS